MDDEVAGLGVAQVSDEGLGLPLPATDARGGRRLEEVPLGVDGEPDLGEVEAAGQRARRDGELRSRRRRIVRQGDGELLPHTLDLLAPPPRAAEAPPPPPPVVAP